MNFSRFIMKNALRNKRRTALTVLSIGFSLLLLITLRTFLDILFNPPAGEQSSLRVAIRSVNSLAEFLPFSYEQKLRTIPHVTEVMPLQWCGAMYKEPKNFFPNFATDPVKLWEMFPEYAVSAETKKAFAAEKKGAVVQADMLKKFGWKVGDNVTLAGTIFPVDLEFKIVGTMDFADRMHLFYFRMDYLDEAMKEVSGSWGRVGTFWLKADSPEAIPGIIENAEELFKNGPIRVKAETEKAFRLGFTSMLGNVKLLIGSVALVVVFTMLMVTASTMAMTIRERFREIGILKSMGYPGRTVLALILGEALFIALLGGLVGCGVGYSMGFLDFQALTMGFIPKYVVKLQTYGFALGVGGAIGVVSGLWPALQASSMTITEALRRLN